MDKKSEYYSELEVQYMDIVKQEYKKYIGANPYKGFVPFIGKYDIESSMEFFYIPLNDILISKDNLSWLKLEKNLNEIYKRNHTSIIRIYIDYPTLDLGLPSYLKKQVDLIKYDEFGGGMEPNYNNKFLIDELIKFIEKFAKKYDGDDRIAFIECGLIGHWGEWHCYPNEELMPTDSQLEEIIKSYLSNFKKTKILTRYPNYTFLKKYNIGFHDDSFCYSTLPTKDFHFVSQLNVNNFENSYLKNPIGGEVRPEEQDNLVNGKHTSEDYYECIENTKCSWLLFQNAFNPNNNAIYIQQLSSELGYDFYINNIEMNNNILSFDLFNVGIAPIYYDFDCILNVIYKNSITKIKLEYDLRKLLPHQKHRFHYTVNDMQKIDEISFSLEKNRQTINLSNMHIKNNSVIIFERL